MERGRGVDMRVGVAGWGRRRPGAPRGSRVLVVELHIAGSLGQSLHLKHKVTTIYRVSSLEVDMYRDFESFRG